MMSSRTEILSRIRQILPPALDLPGTEWTGIVYDDPVAKFSEVLTGVGGLCERVATLAEAHQRLQEFEPYASAKVRCSLIPGVGETTFDYDAVTDPHDLETVEFAVLPGELAVAENAAVWVTDRLVKHRVLFFLTQHLALIVPAKQIVNNMHQAYEKVAIGETQFAAWLSGPSKTADIEQSLVIGAHGSRSLLVLLVDDYGNE
jgi:L-lactate dehydrogenase complex protein LldG